MSSKLRDNSLKIYGVKYAVTMIKDKIVFIEADGFFAQSTYLVFVKDKQTDVWDIDFEETRGHILILHLIAAFDYARSGVFK